VRTASKLTDVLDNESIHNHLRNTTTTGGHGCPKEVENVSKEVENVSKEVENVPRIELKVILSNPNLTLILTLTITLILTLTLNTGQSMLPCFGYPGPGRLGFGGHYGDILSYRNPNPNSDPNYNGG